jgi:hypothetical protein
MYCAWIPSGVLVAGLGVARTVVLVALLYGLLGVLFEFGNLIWATLLQERVPARVLGRVSSLDWLISVGLYPVGLAVAGPVAAAIGVTAVLVGGGLLSIPITLAGLLWRGVRAADHPAPDGRGERLVPGPARRPAAWGRRAAMVPLFPVSRLRTRVRRVGLARLQHRPHAGVAGLIDGTRQQAAAVRRSHGDVRDPGGRARPQRRTARARARRRPR